MRTRRRNRIARAQCNSPCGDSGLLCQHVWESAGHARFLRERGRELSGFGNGEDVRDSVRRLLTERSFQLVMTRLARQGRAHPPVAEAVRWLEDYAGRHAGSAA